MLLNIVWDSLMLVPALDFEKDPNLDTPYTSTHRMGNTARGNGRSHI